MLYHLMLALRHLLRRKIYSFVIIGSLAVGFFSSGLLVSYLFEELQTDNIHSSSERLYQFFSNDPFEDKGNLAYIPTYVHDYLEKYPEVEAVGAIASLNKPAIRVEQDEFTDAVVVMTDESILKLFYFPLATGELGESSLSNGVLISREKQMQWFGDNNALGKMITLAVGDTTRLLRVEGILDDVPGNSHLKFDVLVHHSVLANAWDGGSMYVRLRHENSAMALAEKINGDVKRPGLLGPGSMTYSLDHIANSYFSPYNKMPHMRTQSRAFVWSGIVVCIMILMMATFNFINLFLLSIQSRKKYTGIKKTMGISFVKLVQGTLAEIFLYITFACVVAAILAVLALPYFNVMLNTSLSLSSFFKLEVVITIVVAVLIIGIIAIIVSAFDQWRTLPISLMRTAVGKVRFSKSMFTIQFFISITLAICAAVIIQQTHHLTHSSLGFNRNIIQIASPNNGLASLLPALKQEVLQIPEVRHTALSNGHPISGNSIVRYDLKDQTFYAPFSFSGDEDYINTLDLKIIQGKAAEPGSDGRLVNEAFVKYFDLKNPIGEKVPGTDFLITGVVKDFTCVSFKEATQPAIIGVETTKTRNMIIDYSGGDLSVIIPKVKLAWQKIYPDYPFFYQVLESDLLKKYQNELFFYRAVVTFSCVSMLISCFGLFALSWAVVQSRTKEMGIRKILGASMKDILQLLTATFFKRITVAFMIAAPLGYYLMQQWLENFVNRISITPWLFIVTGMVVFVIAFLTLSFQTFRAAHVNPVEEIRH